MKKRFVNKSQQNIYRSDSYEKNKNNVKTKEFFAIQENEIKIKLIDSKKK